MWLNNPGSFIPVYYQLDSTPGIWQPWAGTRASFYTLQYTPYLWLDGSFDAGYTYSQWVNDLAVEQVITTDVTIDVTTFRGGDQLDARATVCVEGGGVGKDMRIYFIQVLDNFPAVNDYYRNAFRQVATEDVNVAAGACVDVQTAMTMKTEDMAQPDDIGLIVWAQEPLGSAPADIFQAGYVMNTPGMHADGFESGDMTDWDLVVP